MCRGMRLLTIVSKRQERTRYWSVSQEAGEDRMHISMHLPSVVSLSYETYLTSLYCAILLQLHTRLNRRVDILYTDGRFTYPETR